MPLISKYLVRVFSNLFIFSSKSHVRIMSFNIRDQDNYFSFGRMFHEQSVI